MPSEEDAGPPGNMAQDGATADWGDRGRSVSLSSERSPSNAADPQEAPASQAAPQRTVLLDKDGNKTSEGEGTVVIRNLPESAKGSSFFRQFECNSHVKVADLYGFKPGTGPKFFVVKTDSPDGANAVVAELNGKEEEGVVMKAEVTTMSALERDIDEAKRREKDARGKEEDKEKGRSGRPRTRSRSRRPQGRRSRSRRGGDRDDRGRRDGRPDDRRRDDRRSPRREDRDADRRGGGRRTPPRSGGNGRREDRGGRETSRGRGDRDRDRDGRDTRDGRDDRRGRDPAPRNRSRDRSRDDRKVNLETRAEADRHRGLTAEERQARIQQAKKRETEARNYLTDGMRHLGSLEARADDSTKIAKEKQAEADKALKVAEEDQDELKAFKEEIRRREREAADASKLVLDVGKEALGSAAKMLRDLRAERDRDERVSDRDRDRDRRDDRRDSDRDRRMNGR